MGPTVTLTTDFGTRDPYVAAVKGALLAGCPLATLVDLSHEIAAHDVVEGALFLAQAAPWFPAGCVHLAVVDPGVGTARRPLAAAAGGHLFVLPDNGLLALVLRVLRLEDARVIDASRLGRLARSPLPAPAGRQPADTFHGRDIFAPAAAALACGAPLAEMGPEAGDLAPLGLPQPRLEGDEVLGEIVHVDRFGNLVSNVEESSLGGAACSGVETAAGAVAPLRRTYGEAGRGEALALWNSAGLLEVAVREGSAAQRFGLGRGAQIRVRLMPEAGRKS